MVCRSLFNRFGQAALLAALIALMPPGHAAEALSTEVAARLSPEQQAVHAEWREWRRAFDTLQEGYWAGINARRDERRRKYAARLPLTVDDYVATQPPKYRGPALRADIAKIIAEAEPAQPEKQLAGLADFLASAKSVYGFVPQSTTEREFKRRYAEEALAHGLSADQVVRVYALETGGDGTFDMQAGISPISKQGRPISSALGYAQLLHGNSVNEIVKHGEGFIKRLGEMAAAPGVGAARAQALRNKAVVLRKMLRAARSVPNEWSQQVKLGSTPAGLGIHALNLDADVGPWLQVLKLRGLVETAAKEADRAALSGAELELMNLAGPRTGLEMMQPIGRTMPTANFFSQAGYYRNTIVREKTGAELLMALDARMQPGLKKAGAIEFAKAFEEARARRPVVAPAQ